MNQPMGDLPSDNGPNISTKTLECTINSEDVNIAPDIQKYLAQSLPKTNCCGLTLPVLFERIAQGKWWNPKFDSEVLEEQYKNSSFALTRLRFRFALIYTLIFSTSWLIYFITSGARGVIVNWPFLCTLFGCIFLITIAMLVITHTKMYKRYMVKLSLVIAFALCILSLSLVALTTHSKDRTRNIDVGDSGHFIICIEILLIIYTVTPLPLYICIALGLIYSICFEFLNMHLDTENVHFKTLLVRIVVHLCVHLIAVHIFLMSLARMRGTFMHVGQSLLVRRQLEMEKQLKEKMIHSVMPPKLASWLMEETVVDSESNFKKHSTILPRHSNPGASDFKSLFRPFNMYCMKNVSILFADIVGFTKMSSNKSAEELVNMLNDLFERFDELCLLHGCEKISTLGDCYYCVSGCPEPRSDHAKCCVEMGLGMIEAIQDFDLERGEGVNMRVGVHTGTVLCGIVGTRRFKFDVWSNDVSLANKLESTGQPGRVHISEETSKFLDGSFLLEEGEDVSGHKTYFIESRHTSCDTNHLNVSNLCNLKLIISPASTPCTTSPLLLSSPKDSLATTVPSPENLASVRTSPDISTQFLTPGPFRTKASSLPSILDTDVECDDKKCSFILSPDAMSSKSPISTVSAGKYANKLKQWRVPKFLRKYSDTTPPAAILKKCGLNENLQNSEIINGYQQIPIVIETHEKSDTDENKKTKEISFEKEIIDIRSYLSQSRSNMTPFGRSSSYRSQYGRIHNPDVHPAPRARSSTLTHGEKVNSPRDRHLAISAANPTIHGEDAISLCPSVYSRKDSGIRSTSRRSSIQHQIYAINQSVLASSNADLQHRVSGYYTSSQSSINDTVRSRTRLPPPFNRDCSEIQQLRKQSDLQLIRCVQDNTRSGVSYFVKPPLKPFTLFFSSPEMEKEFRNNAHRNDEKEATDPTVTTSRFNTALDIFISAIIFVLVSISLFLVVDDYAIWLGFFILFTFFETTAILLCAYRLYVKWKISETTSELDTSLRYSERIFVFFSDWYQWHICGGVLVSLPILSVLVNYSCILTSGKVVDQEQPLLVYLVCIGLVHYCNFTQMNWLVKNFLVLVCAIIFLVLTGVVCPDRYLLLNDINNTFNADNNTGIIDFSIARLHLNELYIDIFLLIILIWFLNRESEISYRLSYHRHILSNRDKAKVQNMRNQADWLLHNIIPRHVADQLKVTAKYSENHNNVGILFGSIINFNEMYDESYLMGKEYLRVLNELIADFDELLEKPEYSHVEKIKTIGSTFMAASGLNPKLRKRASDKNEHLHALMDFAIDMQKVIEVFNRDLIEFNLILRIGYSFGDVTAGVIGTTKLYYDIWGDAVNMASRMDSTGVANRIQVNEASLQALEAKYEFEPRGSVYVKGKDNMNVFLLVKKI